MQGGPQRISCCDGCKRSVADMAEAQQQAWRYLEITKRYRCATCARELDAANQRTKEHEANDTRIP
jgi:hypothetical protein